MSIKTVERREDLYTTIHKSIRAMLCDLLVAVGRMDPRDDAEVAATLVRLEQAMALSRAHLQHEDLHVHPLIEARRRGASLTLAREHDAHEAAFARLDAAASEVAQAAPEARETPALVLYRELALYIAEDFRHMHAEETGTNALLWETCTDAELKQVHHAIVTSVAPEEMSAYLRWILPATTPAERAAMLSDMQGGMPAGAFAGVLALARSVLDERAWSKLVAALGPRPVLV